MQLVWVNVYILSTIVYQLNKLCDWFQMFDKYVPTLQYDNSKECNISHKRRVYIA